MTKKKKVKQIKSPEADPYIEDHLICDMGYIDVGKGMSF